MQMNGTDIHDSSTLAVAVDMRLVAVDSPTAKVGIFLPYLMICLTLAAQRIIRTAFTAPLVSDLLM